MRVLLAAFAFGASAWGDAPLLNVRTDVMAVEISVADTLQITPWLRAGSANVAVAQIERWIRSGRARTLAAPLIWSSNAGRGVAESVEEVVYSTEDIRSGGPQNFMSPPVPEVTLLPDIMQARYYSRPLLDVPVAFTTRYVGFTFEIAPTVAEDRHSLSIDVVGSQVCFDGMQPVLKRTPSARNGTFAQPQFRTNRITASRMVAAGEWNLLSRYVVPNERCVLVFLRATVLPAIP